MPMPAIHQFVAGFRYGDAIANAALVLRRLLRGWGCASEIVSETRRTDPRARAEIKDLAVVTAQMRPDDVALLHLSIGSPVNTAFAALRCRKAILYHNITPPHYFRYCNPSLAEDLRRGRRQVAELAGAADVNLAVSAYNAAELTGMGYRDVRVLPLIIDLEALGPSQAEPAMLRRLSDGVRNVLFVGRCAPNKKIEDLLTVMHYLQRHVEPASRLVLAGSNAGVEAYHGLLVARARALGLRDVRFLGSVSQPQLNACYASAHALLCMSEHEGFCAPLLEAMLHGVPVLARAAAAVPETMQGAGVLLRTNDCRAIAEAVGRVLHDSGLRQAILARQQARLSAYRARDLDAEVRVALAPVLTT
ncbi:MAG: glycosyltransferase [Kiritimatiellae bacterium]|nr:glycosyltransferase [Kiritimatiellia bacterium]